MHLQELADRVLPILGFVVCITIVADLADEIGVFRVIARGTARLARGRVWRLWALVVLVAVVSTAVLSLDTTAVLLTPVVLTLATQLKLDPALFAFTAVWLANTASLFLPVSNLTNLLALSRLGTTTPGFFALLWPAAVTAVLVTVAALALTFRRSLRGGYHLPPADPVRDRALLVIAMIVCAGLGPAFLVGVDVLVASAVGAGILVVACLLRARGLLSWRLLPWQLVVGVSVLFVLVQLAHEHGLSTLLGLAAGQGENLAALLRLGGVSALGANLVDNLPAYLAMEPTAVGSPLRMASLLVGVGAGPLVTPWASLATLLWAARCRAAGVPISWGRFVLRGLVLAPILIVTSVSALVLVHG